MQKGDTEQGRTEAQDRPAPGPGPRREQPSADQVRPGPRRVHVERRRLKDTAQITGKDKSGGGGGLKGIHPLYSVHCEANEPHGRNRCCCIFFFFLDF